MQRTETVLYGAVPLGLVCETLLSKVSGLLD